MPAKPPASQPAPTFEGAIERLEHIVEEMESDQLGLEELLARFEQGIQLVKVCEERLAAAEKRIEIVTRNAAGDPQLQSFDAAEKPAPGQASDASLF